MANPKGHGGAVPKHSDEVVMAAYEAYGQREAERRLEVRPGYVAARVARIKARGCTRSEQRVAFAAATAEKEEAFRKIIADSQKAVIQDAGTRTDPHHYRQGNSIQELFDNHSVVPENVTITGGRISEHGMVTNNKKTGEVTTHVLYAKSANIKPKKGPEFPLIGPAALPPKIVHAPAPHILHKVKHAVVLSDAQVWLLRNLQTGELIPTHDPCALEVARCMVAAIAPQKLFGIGDWCDWGVASHYTKYPEFDTLKPSTQLACDLRAGFIAAAPKNCEHVEIPSNHQIRPEKFILEYNREMSGLTRARLPGESKIEWPVFSEAYILRYDDLGIKFSGAYPGGEQEIVPGLVAMHAPDSKKYRFHCDVIHGHDHHISCESYAHYGAKQERHAFKRYSIGCLCSTGRNPNTRSIHPSLVPAFSPRNDWALGLGVVEYIESKVPQHQVSLVVINELEDGARSAIFGGARFYAKKK